MARKSRKSNPVLPEEKPAAVNQRIYAVGGYVRLSLEDSGKPGTDTIEEQKNLVYAFVEQHPDLKLVNVYCDNGRTGTNFERPGFEQLMNDIRTGKIDCIVVKDLSRFGRNYLETGNYLERVFPYIDVRFIAVNDNFDTLTAERNSDGYIIPLKNIINDAYSKDISRKVGSAITGKQKRGEFIGSWASYGYRKCSDDPHRIEPDKETAPVVRKIFAWRLSGLGYAKIARMLNKLLIPAPYHYLYMTGVIQSERYAASQWSPKGVRCLLQNEIYLGDMVQGRRQSSLSRGEKNHYVPKDEWKRVRNTHEPLIDKETFQIVQNMAEKCREKSRELGEKNRDFIKTPNILKGLIFCADCKHPLIRCRSIYKKKCHYIWYCQTHENDPNSCPNKSLHETELFDVLWSTIQKEIILAENLCLALEKYKTSKTIQSRKQQLDHEETEIRQNIKRIGMIYESLFANYVDHLLTEEEYMEMKQQYRSELEIAKDCLSSIQKDRESMDSIYQSNSWVTSFLQYKSYEGLTEGLAHALIERVEVDEAKNIQISLRYRNEYSNLLAELAKEGEV